MASISPTLKLGLGAAFAVAAFSLLSTGGGDEPVLSETFQSPLALVEDTTSAAETWEAPPVTRNPFQGGALDVDEAAVADLVDEAATEDSTSSLAPSSTSSTALGVVGTVSTTEPAASVEEAVSNRLPPAAQTTTTSASDSVSTSTAGGGTLQPDG